ncbi:MAG: hypothetical protein WC805_03135 [Patescibacteria group bacterium]|jgi:hypothetical protein
MQATPIFWYIVVYAFGSGPVASNVILANLAAGCYNFITNKGDSALIFTQKEIPEIPGIDPSRIRYISLKPKAQPTLKIAHWMMNEVIPSARFHAHPATKIMVVAATPHLGRAKGDTEYAVWESGLDIDVRVWEDIAQIPPQKWYCNESKQPHTRSAWAWWLREIPILIIRAISMRWYAYKTG